jgi:hypothetical protein
MGSQQSSVAHTERKQLLYMAELNPQCYTMVVLHYKTIFDFDTGLLLQPIAAFLPQLAI